MAGRTKWAAIRDFVSRKKSPVAEGERTQAARIPDPLDLLEIARQHDLAIERSNKQREETRRAVAEAFRDYLLNNVDALAAKRLTFKTTPDGVLTTLKYGGNELGTVDVRFTHNGYALIEKFENVRGRVELGTHPDLTVAPRQILAEALYHLLPPQARGAQ